MSLLLGGVTTARRRCTSTALSLPGARLSAGVAARQSADLGHRKREHGGVSAEPRRCEECGADISHLRSIARFCSQTCSARAHYRDPENRERRRAWKRTWRQKPGVMERELAQQREYRSRPEVRERRLANSRRWKAENRERKRATDRAYAERKKAEREAKEQAERAEPGEGMSAAG